MEIHPLGLKFVTLVTPSLQYCTLNQSQQLELLHTLLPRFCHERSTMERLQMFGLVV
uniref:Uncharacterized protein n=1 Tax=Medicago truncatula TaxID=3880 RepID=I3S9F5_MEDTR|nr:unknown [Medicago truncatula]AFK45242.1 unknown [Medicago truncatula]